ncbi:MAG: peptidase [Solirubrobacterales bacterium]|nr:peptidase [Solirubrobacterales bacterium]
MICDLHAHYPMHLVPGGSEATLDALTRADERVSFADRVRARLIGLASRFANYRSFFSGPGVTVEKMRAGGVGVALSVLYSPFDEVDLTVRYASRPRPPYFDSLVRQLELVESHLNETHAQTTRVVHDPAELDAALAAGRLAFVHCVEGAFHLGGDTADVERNIAELARRGVAYVTVAHLFYRSVATNAPALPFLPDRLYRFLFRQPTTGLTDLGEAMVRAMVREGVLVDVTHMSGASLRDTFALLDEVDPERRVPVLATHMACRFGHLEYNLDDETIARIGERGGLCGAILCDHYARDGLRRDTEDTFAGSVDAICRQIDRVRSVTRSDDHVGIGSDLDGYIKPMLAGLEDMARMKPLADALRERYGATLGEAICSGNALRVLRSGWTRRH